MRGWLAGAAIAATLVGAVSAQVLGGLSEPGGFARIMPNTPYNGQFTFVRLRYGPPVNFASQRVMWSHDYPTGEQHFMKILADLSYLNPQTEKTNIFALDDPDLFKYPLAYLCEPGAWTMTNQEAETFRAYLQKGGFLIVDDFRYRHWPNFEEQIRRILPDARIVDVDTSDPIFHSFFDIDTLDWIRNYYDQGPPIFRGIYEGNDPKKRLMVMINFNTDISEYWEWSDVGFRPVDESNEAYKLGVNYIIYGMTH
jgi:hypothetical protein